MALTPEDVRNKQFTTVRFKEGYDLDEVDNFLDEIEESLAAVTREAEDLRATAKGEVPESICFLYSSISKSVIFLPASTCMSIAERVDIAIASMSIFFSFSKASLNALAI
jgi:DivIVA domain-containing protein